MQLAEGDTLAERMARGAFDIGETLAVARPQNVKITPEGTAKVLDFGLAKAMDPAGSTSDSSSQLAASPTLTLGATVQGTLLGTAGYMAPEQAKGLVVDKRADIWAFGVVLWETLAGRRLFEGDSVTDTLAAVLREEVDLSALPAETPAAVRRLLRRCLERNPRNRLRDIGDARIALQELGSAAPEREMPSRSDSTPIARRTAVVAALLAVGLIGAAFLVGRQTAASGEATDSPPSATFTRFTRLTNQAGLESSPALSPDGELVAYVAFDGDDRDVFLLRVGGQKPINLTEDSPADEQCPAFSPDGRSIAFRSERDGGGLFVMGATSESVRRLTDFGDNPLWGDPAALWDLCYNLAMDTTIRNLDPEAYRHLKAHAALQGMTIGEAMSEAIRAYLSRKWPAPGSGTLADWKPEPYPPGNERLSEEIDRIVYGA